MKLIHTLLLLIRGGFKEQDLDMAERCLRSLQKSTCKTVVVFNQGCLTNAELEEFLKRFELTCFVIGNGDNTGTVVGRQECFSYIYEKHPHVRYISEIHPDMLFASNWEDALVAYLDANEDEPVIGCGIVSDINATCQKPEDLDAFLALFKRDAIERGFTIPCVHRAEVLKAVGGYDARFLKGKQAFEDDSLLLGYRYYYGTRANWVPKINYNSVVFHAVGGQRFSMDDNLYANFEGLLRQYGAMGIRELADIHVNPWQKQFFAQRFGAMTAEE